MAKPKALVVIPSYVREDGDVETTVAALESVRATQGEAVDVLVVDDGSPQPQLVERLEGEASRLGCDFHGKDENSGFSKTVNVGLERARDEGRHAILMNADVVIQTPGWLRRFLATRDERHRPAAVVGGLLLFPNGTIQHGGIYFSLLTRDFNHLFKYGPANLPEALKRRICPVTGAFQFIRNEALTTVGLYDENFKMGWEDVDYCIRTFLAGEQCVYMPNIRAWHHEMMFRGRSSKKVEQWQAQSFMYLCMKYQHQNFGDLVPFQ